MLRKKSFFPHLLNKISQFFGAISSNRGAILFIYFFFNFTIDTPFLTLLLNQRIHGARKLAAIIAVERRSTGAWGKYGRTNGLPDTMDQRNIVGERGRSAANTRPIVPPEIITDYPDRF